MYRLWIVTGKGQWYFVVASDKIQKHMSASLAEFHRSLGRLLPQIMIEADQRQFVWSEGDRSLDVMVEDLPPKTMGGLIQLPQMSVTLSFDGYDADAKERFLEEFDKIFRRGGG